MVANIQWIRGQNAFIELTHTQHILLVANVERSEIALECLVGNQAEKRLLFTENCLKANGRMTIITM